MHAIANKATKPNLINPSLFIMNNFARFRFDRQSIIATTNQFPFSVPE